MARPTHALLVLAAAAALAACGADESRPAAPPAAPEAFAGKPPAVAPAPAPVVAAANTLPPIKPMAGIENFRRLSDKIAQGGGPETEAQFAALKAEGIVTVISVDGAVPPVALGEAAGMQYVHVPIGYDGLSADEQASIVKAVQQSPGPVFIHCHHGLHRGPAAAALARMSVDGISHEAATLELKESGCSPNYTGLYRDVAEYKEPSAATLAALGKLPSAVKPAGVQDAMVHIDEHMDYLKASQGAKWARSAKFPDVSPPHEATMLREAFAEMQRLSDSQALGADFLAKSKASEEAVKVIEDALIAGDLAAAEAAWGPFKASCESCHKTYRN